MGNGDGDGDGMDQIRLRPLVKQLAVPPGAPPRSQVPSVRYDLGVDRRGAGRRPARDAGSREIFERGGASWYGIQFHQRKTASGERFDATAFCRPRAAVQHARLRSQPRGGRKVVRNDRVLCVRPSST
jgi:hypothetical protein